MYECVAAKRQDLIAWLVKEVKKPIEQADSEVSEAIDFIGYYTQQRDELEASGHRCEPRGLTLVCSPLEFSSKHRAWWSHRCVGDGQCCITQTST